MSLTCKSCFGQPGGRDLDTVDQRAFLIGRNVGLVAMDRLAATMPTLRWRSSGYAAGTVTAASVPPFAGIGS